MTHTPFLAGLAEVRMPRFDMGTLEVIFYSVAAVALLIAGYRLGRLVGRSAATRAIQQKEQELFTAQKGFKNLYEQELANVKAENDSLKARVEQMGAKVEEYRKKAAGLGGLFSSGGKKADAMYALLLENEALEEALYAQNEKLKQERTDSLKEQMRATGYRRVLMSQLLNDNRIKEYVAEILNDEKMLPRPSEPRAALPAAAGAGADREDGAP
jgi:predicted RNase H-like nuclease (RuvC/YqgF family)